MIRDYWIYQQHVDEGSPWALYIVKEYEKGAMMFSDFTFDVTLYHDTIPNQTRSHSVVGINGGNVDMVLSDIAKIIGQYTEFTDVDRKQVKQSLLDIVMDTSGRRRLASRR